MSRSRQAAAWFLSIAVLCGASARGAEWWVHDFDGDDVTGNGSVTAPWATLTHALGYASFGDVVHVGPGLYDAASESFPVVVPPGVALAGAGADQTVIDGAGFGWASQDALVLLQGSAEVSGIRFRNGPTANWWDSAVAAWGPGDYVIRNNVFEGPALNRGLVLFDLSATSSSTGSAIVEGNVCLGVGPADALLVFDVPQLNVRHNTVVGGARSALALSSINLSATGSVTNNCFVRNGWFAIESNAPGVAFDHNCLFQNAAGTVTGSAGPITNTIVAEPRFVDEGMGDLHLTPSSPLKDAGAAAGGTTDVDGDAFGSGLSGIDVGADELQIPDLYLRKPAELSTVSTFVTLGPAGAPILVFVGLLPASIPTAYGTFGIDPNAMVQLGAGVLPASGVGETFFVVPPIASIFGLPLIAQALAGFVPNGLTAPVEFELAS